MIAVSLRLTEKRDTHWETLKEHPTGCSSFDGTVAEICGNSWRQVNNLGLSLLDRAANWMVEQVTLWPRLQCQICGPSLDLRQIKAYLDPPFIRRTIVGCPRTLFKLFLLCICRIVLQRLLFSMSGQSEGFVKRIFFCRTKNVGVFQKDSNPVTFSLIHLSPNLMHP